MKFSEKIALFIVCFSGLFYWIHVNGHYDTRIVLADLGGVPWLYSSLVMLFSILAGFVIQKEWDNWNNLIDSVKSEVDALRELWLWSLHLPEEYKNKFTLGIKSYVKEMTQEGLNKSGRGEHSKAIEQSFRTLQESMFEMSQKDQFLMSSTFSFFTKILEARTSRIRYSSHHVPQALAKTLLFITLLVIVLCLFIGIKNIWLDYTYTLSVSLTAFIIYIVINDLDNPLVPGNWHLTTQDYETLLTQISKT